MQVHTQPEFPHQKHSFFTTISFHSLPFISVPPFFCIISCLSNIWRRWVRA